MLPSPSPEPAMPQIHHRVWVAVLVCASECPVREAVPFHSRAHLLGGKDLIPPRLDGKSNQPLPSSCAEEDQ